MTFKQNLIKKLNKSHYNHYGLENYDEIRFGKGILPKSSGYQALKNKVKSILKYNTKYHTEKVIDQMDVYYPALQVIYENLNPSDRNLLVEIIAFRLLGMHKVKLSTNNKTFKKAYELARKLQTGTETLDPQFLHFSLSKFDLRPIGIDVSFFFIAEGVAIDFLIEQYAYTAGNKKLITAEKGDIVLDLGGCWGDTALYFASKIGDNGKVYSFEFIPKNIEIHNINTGLNPHFKPRIELVNRPVGEISNIKMYYKDNGPASYIRDTPFPDISGIAETISIDDFVAQNNIEKVDFIKMDIEGAELPSLKGAINTIRKFKPKLAIAIYHSMDDFINIPNWILDLNLGYKLYLGHYTIHAEETIIFAKA